MYTLLVRPACEPIFNDKKLSLKAKGLAVTLAAKMARNGTTGSVQELLDAKISTTGKHATYSGLKELLKAGHIIQTVIKSREKLFKGTNYIFPLKKTMKPAPGIHSRQLTTLGQLLIDSNLSWKSKGIFTQLIFLSRDTITIHPLESFYSYSKDSEYSIATGLKELTLNGYLDWRLVRDSKCTTIIFKLKNFDAARKKSREDIKFWESFCRKYK